MSNTFELITSLLSLKALFLIAWHKKYLKYFVFLWAILNTKAIILIFVQLCAFEPLWHRI